jgi:hypothetical protein
LRQLFFYRVKIIQVALNLHKATSCEVTRWDQEYSDVFFQAAGNKKELDQIIEQKCKLLGKTGINKGSLLHLQQWMTGQLGANQTDSPITPEVRQEIYKTDLKFNCFYLRLNLRFGLQQL